MNKEFIKIVDPELALKLITLGFQYIKEQSGFAFIYNEELTSILEQQEGLVGVTETKLTF